MRLHISFLHTNYNMLNLQKQIFYIKTLLRNYKFNIVVRKFCSLFNRKICVASLAQLLPSLSLGTNWRLSPKPSLLKKINGSVSNQFATCSACGNSLRSNILGYCCKCLFILSFRLFFESRASPKLVLRANCYEQQQCCRRF